MPDHDAALARFRSFRARFDAEALLDQASGLTAADLDVLIDAAAPHADLEPGGTMSADDLAGMA